MMMRHFRRLKILPLILFTSLDISWLSKEFGCSNFHCTTARKIQYLTKLDPIKEKPLPLSFVLNQSVWLDKKSPNFSLGNSYRCLALWENSGWHGVDIFNWCEGMSTWIFLKSYMYRLEVEEINLNSWFHS